MPPPAPDILSTISETDQLIFKRLCNPAKVDFSVDASQNISDVRLSPLPSRSSPPARKSTFAQAVDASHERPRLASPPIMRSRERPSMSSPPPPMAGSSPPRRAASPSGPAGPSLAPVPGPLSSKDEERHRRHSNLLHLAKMKHMGTKLTRDFSMEDSADEMQFEIDYQENNQDVASAVAMMKGALGMGMTGIEMANAKWGPFLNLTGLSTTVATDMSRYNRPLEKIYRRYWRKRSMNPVLELLFLIGGSVLLTHFGNKGGPAIKMLLSTFLGGGGGGNSANEQKFSQRGFDPRQVPINDPPAAPQQPPPRDTTPRRSLRPPGSGPREPIRDGPPKEPSRELNPNAGAASTSADQGTTRYAPPAPSRPTAALIFPIAGTPLRNHRGEPPIMSLPTVIEEIVEPAPPPPRPSAPAPAEDIDTATFDKLMREVIQEEEA